MMLSISQVDVPKALPYHSPKVHASRRQFFSRIKTISRRSSSVGLGQSPTMQLPKIDSRARVDSLFNGASFRPQWREWPTTTRKQIRSPKVGKQIGGRHFTCQEPISGRRPLHRTLSLATLFNMSTKKSTSSTKKKRLSFFNIFPWRKNKHKDAEQVSQSDPCSPPTESKRIFAKNTPRSVKNGTHLQNGASNKKYHAPPPPLEDPYMQKKGLSMDNLQIISDLGYAAESISDLSDRERGIDLETKSCSALPVLDSSILERHVEDEVHPSTSERMASDHDDSGVDSSKSDTMEATETAPIIEEPSTSKHEDDDTVKLIESVTETIRTYNKEVARKKAKLDEAQSFTSTPITKPDGTSQHEEQQSATEAPSNLPTFDNPIDERPPLPVTPPPPLNQYPRRKYKISSGRADSIESDLPKPATEEVQEEKTPFEPAKTPHAVTKAQSRLDQAPKVERLSNFNLKSSSRVPPIRVSSFDGESTPANIEPTLILNSKALETTMVNTSLWEDQNNEVDAKLNREYKKLTSLFEQWQAMCLNRENLKSTEGIRLQEALIAQHRIVHQLCEKAHVEYGTRSSSTISSVRSNASAKKRISIMTPDVFGPKNDHNGNHLHRANGSSEQRRHSASLSVVTDHSNVNGEASKPKFPSPSLQRCSDGPANRRIYGNQSRPSLNKSASICEDSDDDSSAVTLLSSRTFSSVDISASSPNHGRSPSPYNNYSNGSKAITSPKLERSTKKYRVEHDPPKSPLNLRGNLANSTTNTETRSTRTSITSIENTNNGKRNTESLKSGNTTSERQIPKTKVSVSFDKSPPAKSAEANGFSKATFARVKPSEHFDSVKRDVVESQRKYEERKRQNSSSQKTSLTEVKMTTSKSVDGGTKITTKISSPDLRKEKSNLRTVPEPASSTPKTIYSNVSEKDVKTNSPPIKKNSKTMTTHSSMQETTRNSFDGSNENIFGSTLRKVGMPVEKVGIQLGRVLDTVPNTMNNDTKEENIIPPAPPLPMNKSSNGPPPPPIPPLPPVNNVVIRMDPNALRSEIQTVRLKPAATTPLKEGPKDTRDLLMEAIRQAGGSKSLKKVNATSTNA